jgi:hypothetical protein
MGPKMTSKPLMIRMLVRKWRGDVKCLGDKWRTLCNLLLRKYLAAVGYRWFAKEGIEHSEMGVQLAPYLENEVS